ncbi:MAG: nuclear transport factor 2 family protein [Nonlabens sp.]
MRKIFVNFVLIIFAFTACSQEQQSLNQASASLNEWHEAAAAADYESYFNLMTVDAVFVGTDATENWNRKEFMAYAKPHFDKGKAWSFTSIERNIYEADNLIYFDELLNTQMGICRGSGMLKKQDGQWKVAHYVLSIVVPNENVKELTALKKDWDDAFIKENQN